MAWKTAGGEEAAAGSITKWNVTGQTVEGILESKTQGKYGMLLTIRKADGTASLYPEQTVLANKLRDVKIGDRVHIEYLGKVRGKSGTEYKDFAVLYDDGASAPIQPSPVLLNHTVTPISGDVVAEYGRLYDILVKAKGEAVAKLVGQTCSLSADPAEALRSALDQLGVVPF